MVTPVFHILDHPQALAFYIDWLGFRIDWEDLPTNGPVYLQVSRADIVLHLSADPSHGGTGSQARAEVQGLPAYHHQLISKGVPPMLPSLVPAYWNDRVLEMEVVDPFGNSIIFCEPGMLSNEQ